MTEDRIDHIALIVESLHQAENLYVSLFAMQVRQREGRAANGEPQNLSTACDCRSIAAGGSVIDRSLLERDGLRLSLQKGIADPPTAGRLGYIGLRFTAEETQQIGAQAEALGCRLLANNLECLLIEDTLGIRWRLAITGVPASSAPGSPGRPPSDGSLDPRVKG